MTPTSTATSTLALVVQPDLEGSVSETNENLSFMCIKSMFCVGLVETSSASLQGFVGSLGPMVSLFQ